MSQVAVLAALCAVAVALPAPQSKPQTFTILYGLPERTGNSLSPTELGPGPAPAPVPTNLQGSDVMPTVILPENTRLSVVDDRGQYSHAFSDKQGTQVSEQGSLLSTNEGWEYVIVKKGSYSYKSPEGKTITVNYIADHNGFRVLGDSDI